jgi:formamidopyrimidine-DNA glycosylase
MPELPEIETIRLYLKDFLINKEITDIEILSKKQFPQEKEEVLGRKVVDISRFAKVLVLKLDNKKTLAVHLKLSGQLVWIGKKKEKITLGHPIPKSGSVLPGKTTRIIITFENGKLFFNDLRKFGWIKLWEENQLKKETEKLGLEPLEDKFTKQALYQILQSSRRAVKILLMDQLKISGIGNIYANEALFESRIDPRKPAKEISKKQAEDLRKAIVKVLKKGIKYGGSSGKDELYIRPDGTKGEFQNYFKVYQRQGELCKNCKGTVKRINLGGRGTFFCPNCQK